MAFQSYSAKIFEYIFKLRLCEFEELGSKKCATKLVTNWMKGAENQSIDHF